MQKHSLTTSLLVASLSLTIAAPAHAVILDVGHTDILPRYQAGTWTWTVVDENGDSFALDSILFRANANTRQTSPANPALTPVLGTPGSPIWVLPQSEQPGKLFLGIDASTTGTGIFTGNVATFTLDAVSGPGEFAMYTVDGFGIPTAYFNTRDGINPAADKITLNSASSHSHFAWAFSAPGDYAISVIPSGTLAGSGEPIIGPAVDWNFRVVPEPGSAALIAVGGLCLARRRRSLRR